MNREQSAWASLGKPPAASAEEADRLARAKACRPMILTPIYRDPSWRYTRSLYKTGMFFERLGIRHWTQWVLGNSNLPRARNELAAEFLGSDYSCAILIDADMGWEPNSLLRLMASEQQVIGGVGRKKSEDADSTQGVWCVRWLGGPLEQDRMGNLKVAGVGTGFLKIEREVFVAMIASGRVAKRKALKTMPPAVGANYYRFFRFGDDEYDTGEDYGFCNEWRELGGSVWIDPTIKLSHSGDKDFTGCIGDHIVASETAA